MAHTPDVLALQRIEQLTLAIQWLDQLDLDATALPPTFRSIGSIVIEMYWGGWPGEGKDAMESPGAA